ncbi:unnamed protein product [Heligmosomoides polygyrus]|uniref:Phlebovirus glycoprotein G2 fusion domain-containing protein n=1 Tax=Heligmosomoides polygyrus TaxID=6339 RepID=A0A3P8ALR8_HELPZ|nr:unnamed protein product [Heligmosomoides polygyrus]
MLADPNLPTNTWKMGRITNATANSEGIVELVMPNRRVTKRAINQLIPLELGGPDEQLADSIHNDKEDMEENPENQRNEQRYNPRRKPRVNYDRLHHGVSSSIFALAIMSLISTAFSAQFISDGRNTALWKNPYPPTLQCPSYEDAKALQCYLHPNYRCQPAESTVNCLCTDSNVTANFYELRYGLPIRRPWITFMESGGGSRNVSVTAVVPNFSTAEFLLTIHEQFDATIKEVTDPICKVQDADVTECYQCDQGAVAQITCQREDETMATIDCGDFTFSIPCNPQGVVSSLRFNLQHAQVHLTCSCSCGATKMHFELTGVLLWTRTFYGIAEKLLARESNVYNEVKLPDLSHISSVLVAWYEFSIALVF